jgi:hypothetical protein
VVDDVYKSQKQILGTAFFIGFTTWTVCASLYYLVERKSKEMIYCGAGPEYCPDEVDTSLCLIDEWGFVDCSEADCPSSEEYPHPCYNLYESIPLASFYTLLNLFGEFPLGDQHNTGGMIVGTFTAVIAVAVFALPASIVASGFEEVIEKRVVQDDDKDSTPSRDHGLLTPGFESSSPTFRGFLYNFLHAETISGATVFDYFINVLVIGTAITFMADTFALPGIGHVMDIFEFFAVIIFTLEYGARIYSSREDPMYSNGFGGLMIYLTSFLPMVDLLSVLPYWIEVMLVGSIAGASNLVKALRLLRIFRFEKYTHAFTSFDDILVKSKDVLAVTAFTAVLLWVFFSAFLYLTERDNPDEEMSSNYNTVPNAMVRYVQ